MDINMPGMNGISAASEIRSIRPATKIVFLTVHDGPGFVAETGPWAHGFVPKSAAGTELHSHAAAAGRKPAGSFYKIPRRRDRLEFGGRGAKRGRMIRQPS